MWRAASDQWLSVGLAVFFIGWAIKLMDDYVDRELDQILDRPNLTRALGDGLPIYLALVVAVAVYLAPVTALTLFLAAYLVGMGDELGLRYRTGWWGWMEVVIAGAIGIAASGSLFVLNLMLILLIQLADDLHDLELDRVVGRHTLPSRLGIVPTGLVLFSLVMAVTLSAPVYSLWVMICAWAIAIAAERMSKNDDQLGVGAGMRLWHGVLARAKGRLQDRRGNG